MQQSTLLRFCLVDFFPLWHSMLSGPIGAPAAHKSILQHSRLSLQGPTCPRNLMKIAQSLTIIQNGWEWRD